MTVAGDQQATELEVSLYCRASTSTATAVDRYHDDLDRLRSRGPIDGIDVVTWPSRVELRSSADDEAVRAYEEFSAWADENDLDLEPAFNVREYESEFTGEKGTALVTPVACLAVYRDGELTDVYPHVDDGEVRTVEDGIESIETGATDGRGADPGARPIAGEPAE